MKRLLINNIVRMGGFRIWNGGEDAVECGLGVASAGVLLYVFQEVDLGHFVGCFDEKVSNGNA